MFEFFDFIRSAWTILVGLLNSVSFTSEFGLTVSLFDIIISGILLCFIINIFWKGARA